MSSEEIVETPAVQEEAVEEVANEEQPAQEAQETKPEPMAMDFSDLGIEDEYLDQEPDTEDILRKVVQEAIANANRTNANPVVEDDIDVVDDGDEMVKKSDLKDYVAKLMAGEQQKHAQMTRNQQIIQANKQQSDMLVEKYGNKVANVLKSNDIDIDQNPALKSASETLFNQLYIQKVASLGRPLSNPVLTPNETKEVIKDHWNRMSSTYLSNIEGLTPKASRTPTNLANMGIQAKQEAQAQSQEELEYQQKKENGKLTPFDVMKKLQKFSQN